MRYHWNQWGTEAGVVYHHGDSVGAHRNGLGPGRLEDSVTAAGYLRGYRQDNRSGFIPYPTFEVTDKFQYDMRCALPKVCLLSLHLRRTIRLCPPTTSNVRRRPPLTRPLGRDRPPSSGILATPA